MLRRAWVLEISGGKTLGVGISRRVRDLASIPSQL